MSQPNTTSQKPKPPSAAEKNLSLWMYFPRSTPSMSDTATLTRVPSLLRTVSSTFSTDRFCGMRSPGGFPSGIVPKCGLALDGTIRAMDPPTERSASRAQALGALHLAVALFGFAGLFGKWLALPAVTIVLGRTLVASAALAALLRLGREPRADRKST